MERLRAIDYLDEIINQFGIKWEYKKGQDIGYFGGIENDLWKYMVYYPALLIKSETLSKLQRSKECGEEISILINENINANHDVYKTNIDGIDIQLGLDKYKIYHATYLKLSSMFYP